MLLDARCPPQALPHHVQPDRDGPDGPRLLHLVSQAAEEGRSGRAPRQSAPTRGTFAWPAEPDLSSLLPGPSRVSLMPQGCEPCRHRIHPAAMRAWLERLLLWYCRHLCWATLHEDFPLPVVSCRIWVTVHVDYSECCMGLLQHHCHRGGSVSDRPYQLPFASRRLPLPGSSSALRPPSSLVSALPWRPVSTPRPACRGSACSAWLV